MMGHPLLYRFAIKIGRFFQPLHDLVNGTFLDPLRAWTSSRKLPKLASTSFQEQWKKERGGEK